MYRFSVPVMVPLILSDLPMLAWPRPPREPAEETGGVDGRAAGRAGAGSWLLGAGAGVGVGSSLRPHMGPRYSRRKSY